MQDEELHNELKGRDVFPLHNQGNQCFADVILTTILRQTELRHAIIDRRWKSTLCKVLCNIMLDLNEQQNWTRDLLLRTRTYLGDGKQHDAHEFLQHLLDKLSVSNIETVRMK